MRDYFTKFSQEALGPNIAIDNVRVMVDVVCVQAVYQLLQLGVVKDLATDSCRIAGVVGELDRVDGINLRIVSVLQSLLAKMSSPQTKEL